VTVVSPSTSATAPIAEDTALTVDATADAISSASVDVLSGASPVAFRELRLELGGRVVHEVARAVAVRGTARTSHEPDYLALRAGAGITAELAARTLTLGLDYLAGRDRAGDVSDETFDRRRVSHGLMVTATQVLDRRTWLDLVVDAQLARGYHASPYRRVPIVDPAWPLPTWVDEQTPSLRRSLAVAARARRAVGAAWFVGASQRLYVDDWSMTSHTTTLEVRHQLDDVWLLGATARGYLQEAASFHRRVYLGEVPALRTRDRALGGMRTLFGSLTVDRAVGDGEALHVVVACGVLAMRFLDSAVQARRLALVTTASVTYAF
jgi:hypothetical protein